VWAYRSVRWYFPGHGDSFDPRYDMLGCSKPHGACQYELSVHVEPMPDVAPQQHQLRVVFTNRTAETCDASGSPGVRLTGPRLPGATYPDPVYELPAGRSSKSVRLEPLEEAHAVLTFVSPARD